MSHGKKKVPAAFAVVDQRDAPKLAAAEGKLALMRRIRELSGDGEKLVAFLLRVIAGDGTIGQGLQATEILLSHGWGKPITLTVTADATPGGHVSGDPLDTLSTAQLEVVAVRDPAGSQTLDAERVDPESKEE
jgi:hypothetical protein